uniref:PDZ domain-containing protein n=1 Tax=Echeneis naucrates TaxID=173247 RepID=A0A665X1U0_ECHNA
SVAVSNQQEEFPESGVIVKTAKDGCAEGLIYGGGGKEGIFIKEVVPESPASKSLKLKEGDQILSATVYFDNVSYEDAIQILEHAQAYKVKLCLKRKPDITETEPAIDSNVIPVIIFKFKFKMPKFGVKMPKIKGPEFDLSMSKKDGDVTLPEAKAGIKLPDAPKVDIDLGKADVSIPEMKIEVEKPELEVKPLQTEVELDGQGNIHLPETQLKSPEGVIVDIKTPDIDVESPSLEVKTTSTELDGKGSKFKMPKFGISMPKVKRPETDLSLPKKDIDVTLPQADIELPDVKAPEVMPTFKLPKFGVSTPKVSAEAPDIKIPDDGAAIDTEAPNTDFEGPSIDLKTTEMEHEGKGSKFKMPHFGFSMPKVKGPKIDLSLSQKDVDVTLPEAKAGVKLPGLDLGEVDVSIPKTKMEVPGVKADVHLPEGNLGKVDVSIPETKIEIPTAEAELKLPEAPKIAVAIKSPEFEADMDGHGGKFKIPKFGIKMPKVKGPEFDLSLSKKDVDARLPEMKGEAKLPDAPKVNVSLPDKELEIKAEDERSNFKMPKFGMSMEKVKGPEFHLGFSKKDVDVKLPETKADINLPDVDLKTSSAKVDIKAPEIDVPEGSPSKFKMPSFSMPKVKGPDIDLSLSKKQIDVTLPETKSEVPKMDVSLGKAEVLIPDTKVEVKKPEVQVRNVETDVEGQGGKFKMPKFGITMPKVHGPEFDLRFSKKDTDVTLPGAKAKVEIPEAPKTALDVKPECEVEIDGQGSRFKLPKFEMSMPKVKGPDIDFSLPKKDVDVTLPEGKAEVQLPDVELKDPSAKVEFKDSEMKAQLGHVEGSPSKFKLPTFKLPKFGAGTAHITAEVPNLEKDIKVDGAGLEIPKHSTTGEIAAPSVDIEGPSLDVKMTGKEGEGKGIKFKIPKFGITMPKGPEIDLSLSKKDIDVKLPEAKAEVNLPQGPEIDVNLGNVDVSIPEAKVEVKKSEFDGKGGKFKIPKFGMSMPKVKGPEIDLSSSKKDVDITLPEGTAEVNLPAVELKEHSVKVEVNAPEIQAQLSSSKGSPSKFKLPTFNFPKFGVTTPNISAELPDGDKEIKIDGAQIQMPEPHIDVDVPDVKAELSLPEVKAPSGADVHVEIPAVQVEVKGGEVGMKPPEGEAEFEEQGKKFKMPKVSGPEINLSLSKPDVDVALPEPKAEVQLPDVEMKGSSAEVEMKTPEVKVSGKETSPSKFKIIDTQEPSIDIKTTGTEREGKGSKFKLPSLGFSPPHVKGPEIDLSMPSFK